MINHTSTQEFLAKLGLYTGEIDGDFGPKTKSALAQYKKSIFLEGDELDELTSFAIEHSLNFNHTLKLSDDQYYKIESKKDSITIHHIAGWSINSNGQNNVNFFYGWQDSAERVGTAFSIGFNGEIYCHFSPNYWAHHLGLKHAANGVKNRSSIGIELANEGAIKKNIHGKWSFWAGPLKQEVEPVHYNWRKGEDWTPYTEAQMKSVTVLTTYLSKLYNIPLNFTESNLKFMPEIYERPFAGVYAHANVRKDKTDPSPAFDWSDFAAACKRLNFTPGIERKKIVAEVLPEVETASLITPLEEIEMIAEDVETEEAVEEAKFLEEEIAEEDETSDAEDDINSTSFNKLSVNYSATQSKKILRNLNDEERAKFLEGETRTSILKYEN